MKMGRNAGGSAKAPKAKTARVSKNHNKLTLTIGIVIAVTLLMIIWVYSIGAKTQKTIPVIMYNENIYKNETITEDMLVEYDMLVGEYEKYAVTQEDGTKKRRILTWDERENILGTFAAYTLQENTVAMYTDFINSRIDNSDSVLYSFPGKNIVKLNIADTDLQTFKTFLQPGDRINIVAIYSTDEQVTVDDGFGGQTTETVSVFREETIFPDVMLADLLNSQGDSILDIYASYNEKTVYQQAALDADEAFQTSVTPSTMIVALTPEEEEQYYYYLGLDNIEFRLSLPQRAK